MRRPSPTTCNSSNRIDRYLGNRRAACHKHLCRYSSAGGILFCCVVFLCMRASVDLTDVVFRASRRYSSWTVNRKRSAGVRAHWRVTATPSGVNGTSQINVADSKPSCSLVGGGLQCATIDWDRARGLADALPHNDPFHRTVGRVATTTTDPRQTPPSSPEVLGQLMRVYGTSIVTDRFYRMIHVQWIRKATHQTIMFIDAFRTALGVCDKIN